MLHLATRHVLPPFPPTAPHAQHRSRSRSHEPSRSCLLSPRLTKLAPCSQAAPGVILYSEAHLSKQNRSQAVGQATAYAERARARAGSHVRRAMRQHQARACHTASAAMLRMAREGGVGCAGATMVDAQHARRPRVGGMRRHAHAWESVMGRHLPNRRPCTLSSQSTSAATVPLQLRCSTTSSGNRRHLADCRPRLLPPQHTVAATPAKPSTMATGQAPCGLSGGPAEQA